MKLADRPDDLETGAGERHRVLLGMQVGSDRAHLAAVLARGGLVLCGEFDDARNVVDVVSESQPDVVLIDEGVRGDAIGAAYRALDADPDLAVVLLGDRFTGDALFAALDAGVAGVLPADIDRERLPHILRAVLTGEAALPRVTMTRVLQEFSARSRHEDPHAEEGELSPRQREVLALLLQGWTTSQIADSLFISAVTVRSHVLGILRRLDLPDRDALIEHFSAC